MLPPHAIHPLIELSRGYYSKVFGLHIPLPSSPSLTPLSQLSPSSFPLPAVKKVRVYNRGKFLKIKMRVDEFQCIFGSDQVVVKLKFHERISAHEEPDKLQ
jgi:hypothetical protein